MYAGHTQSLSRKTPHLTSAGSMGSGVGVVLEEDVI